jgi:hypothetical protein
MSQHSMLVRSAVAGLGLALLGLSGCSTWMKDRQSVAWPWDDKPMAPTKVAAVWTDTVLTQPGVPARRGFGGRIMFYGDKNKEPVKVEGSLVVYAFDEEGRAADNVKPDRKFVFTEEQFAKHYSKSNIGHSYSVWLPWDDAGGLQKEMSLIVRFIPKTGPVVIGEQTRHVLPGPTKEMLAAEKKEPQPVSGGPTPAPGAASQVRAVSHEAPPAADGVKAASEPSTERKLQTTTIRLPLRTTARPLEALGIHAAADATAAANPAAGAAPARPQGAMPAQPLPAQRLSALPLTSQPSAPSTSGPQSLAPANPATATPATGMPAPPPRTPQARSALSRPRVLAAPVARLERDRAGSRQFPSAPSIHPTPEQLVPDSMRATTASP